MLDAGIEASACARKSTTSTSTVLQGSCEWFILSFDVLLKLLTLTVFPVVCSVLVQQINDGDDEV